MPGRIPWERISGDDVETIIAVSYATSLDDYPDNKNEYTMHSEVSICDLCIERKITLKPEDRNKVSQVFIGPLFDLSAYEQYAIPYR